MQEALEQVILLKNKDRQEGKLANYICPKCGNKEKFTTTVYGNAVLDKNGDLSNTSMKTQGNDSLITCEECQYSAKGYSFLPKMENTNGIKDKTEK